MARKNRQRLRKKFLYFFLNGKIHKVLKDYLGQKMKLIAWCYPDKKRVMYSYSQVEKDMEKAYSIIEAGKILNRHRVTIEEYILQGKIKKPQKVYPISNPDSTWSKVYVERIGHFGHSSIYY
jgi:DNA repair photolyase